MTSTYVLVPKFVIMTYLMVNNLVLVKTLPYLRSEKGSGEDVLPHDFAAGFAADLQCSHLPTTHCDMMNSRSLKARIFLFLRSQYVLILRYQYMLNLVD